MLWIQWIGKRYNTAYVMSAHITHKVST